MRSTTEKIKLYEVHAVYETESNYTVQTCVTHNRLLYIIRMQYSMRTSFPSSIGGYFLLFFS